MSTITYTRGAKCKDCKFLYETYKGKLKRHYCGNKESKEYSSNRGLNDLVCDNWKLS